MDKTKNILLSIEKKEEREILNDELKHVEISLKCDEKIDKYGWSSYFFNYYFKSSGKT